MNSRHCSRQWRHPAWWPHFSRTAAALGSGNDGFAVVNLTRAKGAGAAQEALAARMADDVIECEQPNYTEHSAQLAQMRASSQLGSCKRKREA